jgi:hypothetical protein
VSEKEYEHIGASLRGPCYIDKMEVINTKAYMAYSLAADVDYGLYYPYKKSDGTYVYDYIPNVFYYQYDDEGKKLYSLCSDLLYTENADYYLPEPGNPNAFRKVTVQKLDSKYSNESNFVSLENGHIGTLILDGFTGSYWNRIVSETTSTAQKIQTIYNSMGLNIA